MRASWVPAEVVLRAEVVLGDTCASTHLLASWEGSARRRLRAMEGRQTCDLCAAAEAAATPSMSLMSSLAILADG